MQTIAMPADTNASGDIFGGWLVSQMDLGGAVLAKQIARVRVVTVAIDSMVFHKPVRVGDVVSCYATEVKRGSTSLKIKVEVWVIPDGHGPLTQVTEGMFTYVALDRTGRPQKLTE